MRIDHYDLQGEVQYRQQQAQSRKVRNLGPVPPVVNPPEGNNAAVAGERIALQGRNLDRFEQERVDFHLRVRRAYLERARTAGQRIRVINADRPLAEIRAEVEAAVRHLCA